MVLRRITNGNCSPPCSGGSGSAKPQSGFALCAVLPPPHLGQGSMLRIALLPAPNVSYLYRYAKLFLKRRLEYLAY